MSLTKSPLVRAAKEMFTEFSEDRCMQMAAALAYYMIFSIVPLMMIIIGVVGAVMETSGMAGSEQEVRQQIVDQLKNTVGTRPAEQIATMLAASQDSGGGTLRTIISVIALLFGATAVVGQLQASLNQAWEVEPDPDQGGVWTFARKRILSLALVLGIALLMLVSLVLSMAIEIFNDYFTRFMPESVAGWLPRLTNFLLQLLVTTGLFAAIFKVLPDAKIRWRDVGVGAFATALAFGIGRYLISFYLGRSTVTEGFGDAASLVLLLVWIYYSSVIFFLGVEFTQVYVRSRGRRIEPEPGAVRVIRQTKKEDGPH